MKPFPVRATHYPFCIYTEDFGPVALILHSLIVHGELHVLFHSVLLTVQIIVIRTVPCICHGIFGIDPIQAVEFLHQGHKTVCVGSVLLPAQFFRMSVRYLLTSIPSMNRSNTITGSVTERNSSLLWYIILLRYGFHCKWVIPQKRGIGASFGSYSSSSFVGPFFTAPFCTTHVCFRGASALRRLKHVESVFAMLGLTLAALPRLELCGRQENVRGFEAWYKM